MSLVELHFIPIDDDAKHGNVQLVQRGSERAAAWWTGRTWCYRGTNEEIDFKPTHYATVPSLEPSR